MITNRSEVIELASTHLNALTSGMPEFFHTMLDEYGLMAMVEHAQNDGHIPTLLREMAGTLHGKQDDNQSKMRLEARARRLTRPGMLNFMTGSGLWVPLSGYPSEDKYDDSLSFGENIAGLAEYKPPITREALQADFSLETGAQLRGADGRVRKIGYAWEHGVTAAAVISSGFRELTNAEFENYDWNSKVGSDKPGDEFNALIHMGRRFLDLGPPHYLFDKSDNMIAAELESAHSGDRRKLIIANGPLTSGPMLNRDPKKISSRAPSALQMLIDNDIIEDGVDISFSGTVPHGPSRQFYEAATVLHGYKHKRFGFTPGVTGIPIAEAVTASLLVGEFAGTGRNTIRALMALRAGEFAATDYYQQALIERQKGPTEFDKFLSRVLGRRLLPYMQAYLDTHL